MKQWEVFLCPNSVKTGLKYNWYPGKVEGIIWDLSPLESCLEMFQVGDSVGGKHNTKTCRVTLAGKNV